MQAVHIIWGEVFCKIISPTYDVYCNEKCIEFMPPNVIIRIDQMLKNYIIHAILSHNILKLNIPPQTSAMCFWFDSSSTVPRLSVTFSSFIWRKTGRFVSTCNNGSTQNVAKCLSSTLPSNQQGLLSRRKRRRGWLRWRWGTRPDVKGSHLRVVRVPSWDRHYHGPLLRHPRAFVPPFKAQLPIMWAGNKQMSIKSLHCFIRGGGG